jgi:glycosyltransferase involved in cell wall biosynthesis
MKKAICVSAFDSYSYNVRIKHVEKVLKTKGYEVLIVTSNYDHLLKEDYQTERSGTVLVDVPKYKSNLSLKRLWSHYCFAKQSYQFVKEKSPDLVYVSGPPNSLYKFFNLYKKNNPKIKVIFDIVDLWPESIPLNDKLLSLLSMPMNLWRKLRDNNLSLVDHVIFECNLYKKKIDFLDNCITLYLCKEDCNCKVVPIRDMSEIKILYLGSINNIIDINLIINLLTRLREKKKIVFHIVGNGEYKENFINQLQQNKICYQYHGVIYDSNEKEKIFKECHFALNMMKNIVCVGATMKSIDYLNYGVPMINSIPGDIMDFIEQYNCGINLCTNNIEDVVDEIIHMSSDDNYNLRINAQKLFYDKFSVDVFEEKFDNLIDHL